MNIAEIRFKPLIAALIAASVLSACGGGGGSDPTPPSTAPSDGSGTTPGGNNPPGGGTATSPSPVPSTASMTMSCPDGAGYQCSGSAVIRNENSVTLTSSGVQVLGRSTSDLADNIVNKTTATGFQLAPAELAANAIAEIRVAKASTGAVSSAALLLNNLGLTWDGTRERPQIIETFTPTAGRVNLTSDGRLAFTALPPPTDLSFYDYATRTVNGTQINYANNRYFPRTDPSRCPADVRPCPTAETAGLQNAPGDWRAGGGVPDWVAVTRLHEDGDIHAGNGQPTSTGAPTYLTGADGPGVPFPGSKGFRNFSNWGYQYANLGTWVSQDTVLIEEWAARNNEHNKNRRGIVAFGDVTNPAAVPVNGTATYSGIAYGWYAPTPSGDPPVFLGVATATVNFATRQVTVTVQNAATYDAANTPVPVNFTATTAMGAPNTNVANYLTGSVSNGTMSGGISARYFGPVSTTGNAGPAEIGGAFRMANAAGNVAVIGGFIARKQP